MDESPLLVMTHVARRFGSVRAVEDASLAILRGTTVGLLGESGCGKSTLARLATGLLAPHAGELLYNGAPLRPSLFSGLLAKPPPPRRIAMVFQDALGSLDPRWSIGRSISEPIASFKLRTGKTGVRDRAIQMMGSVGLSERLVERRPHELSLGQVQRAAVARALAGEPEFLVCDEPTSALDVSVQAQILNLMRDLQRRLGLTYLFISHNLAVVRHMSDRLGVMYLGRIVELGDAETIFRRPLHPYTRLLLDAIPDLDHIGRARTPVGGDVPSPIAPPPGCAFHPRCPLANDRCRVEAPALLDADEAQVACHAVAEGRA
jgi:peptide/nickel transport system ATP-binding protein